MKSFGQRQSPHRLCARQPGPGEPDRSHPRISPTFVVSFSQYRRDYQQNPLQTHPRKLGGWEGVKILYKQRDLVVMACWQWGCVRKLLHHGSISHPVLQHSVVHLAPFIPRFMNPTCGHFPTMRPRCSATPHLHINVPGPSGPAERRRERRRSLLFLAPLQPLLLRLPPAQGHPGGAGRAVGAGCRNGTLQPPGFALFSLETSAVTSGDPPCGNPGSKITTTRRRLSACWESQRQEWCKWTQDRVLGTARARDAGSPSPQGHASRHQRAPEPCGVPSTTP